MTVSNFTPAKPDHLHEMHRVGMYAAFWDADKQVITIRADNERRVMRGLFPRTHVVTWDEAPTLHEAATLIEKENGEAGPVSAEEMLFLLHIASSVETFLEHAPHDLATYGEVGVTC